MKPHKLLLLQAKGERVGLAPLGLRGGLVRELLEHILRARPPLDLTMPHKLLLLEVKGERVGR